MKHRKLRIAWSAAWGVAAMLLCVLWVRSYETNQTITRISRASVQTSFDSYRGTIQWRRTDYNSIPTLFRPNVVPLGWRYREIPVGRPRPWSSFVWSMEGLEKSVRVPHWLLLLVCGVAASSSWIPAPKRISLRTLLIATTLIAVGMGFVVWMSRTG
jgi:hypothetical protein